MMLFRRPSASAVTSWTLLLIISISSSTVLAFTPSMQNHQPRRSPLQRSTSLSKASHHILPAANMTPRTTTRYNRLNFALFARGPGRPKKDAAKEEGAGEEDGNDDVDYEEDEDVVEGEDEEGTLNDEEIEIGNADDEEEDEEEYEIEYEYEEDELEEEEFDEGDEDMLEEEGVEAPDGSVDIWATYDAANEDPVTPLLDDVPSDPNYKLAKETILSQVEARKTLAERESKVPRNFESPESITRTFDYILNKMSDEERAELENDVDLQEVEKIVSKNNMMLTEDDLKDIIITDDTGETMLDPKAIAEAGSFDDDRGIDAFPSSSNDEDGENLVYPTNGAFDESDLVDIDDKIKAYKEARARLENQTYFGEDHTFAYIDVEKDWPRLSNETQDEILDVIENSNTMASPEPELWLMYDLKFNVTNLILASFKHNQEAPIMFTQWMPQLEVYARYADQREKEFHWTWDDVEQADMEELERYYKGIGYDSIPKKDPSETGVITLDESEMDDEEREMLALENWYDEVYNEETANLLFDDENFEPRDNVYDDDFGTSSSDKSAALEEKFMKEFETFEREFSEETQEWRDQFATVEKFEYRDDPEGQKEFRGHLVIACTPTEDDVDLAEKITERFRDEFGKAVFVETRVLGHARTEDNVFEVWLESYEIDLLHSKRQAFINSKLWDGPSEVDDKQLEYLVDEVKYLISDDARDSYRMSDYSEMRA